MDARRKRLRRILDLRAHEERERRQALALTLAAEREAQALAEAAAAALLSAQREAAERLGGAFLQPKDLQDLAAAERFLESELGRARRRVSQARDARLRAEDSWKTARQGKRSLERLDEKWAGAEAQGARRSEQKLLDEVALRRSRADVRSAVAPVRETDEENAR